MKRLVLQGVPALLLALVPVGLFAQHLDPVTGAPLGFSGIDRLEGDRYAVVFDTKSHRSERRLGILTLGPDRPPDLRTLPVADWKDPRSDGNDLEGVCALPGRPGELLAVESGSWQGRPGRIFRIALADSAAMVKGFHDLPLMVDNDLQHVGDQYEGLACADGGDGTVLVLLGERGGSAAWPEGRVRWAIYDPEADALTWPEEGLEGVPVQAPGRWLRPTPRHLTGFHLDEGGVLWASAAEEGGDTGPFRSVVYAVALVSPGAAMPVRLLTPAVARWELDGSKVEGLAAPPTSWPHAVLLAVSENELLGTGIHGLEAVLPAG